LAIAARLRARVPALGVVLALAPTLARADAAAALAAEPGLDVRVLEGRAHEAMRAADVAVAKPGTATLELCLLGCPFVVAGRVHPVSAGGLRRLVRVPSWTLPSLLAGRPVGPGFLQDEARPDRVADALAALLEGPARELALARQRE